MNHAGIQSIENGYFVFTLMPSLYCPFNCEHCYLSLEQRRDSTIMSLENLEEIVEKIASYYRSARVAQKTISPYFYGGEPTSMGVRYMKSCMDIFDRHFPVSDGYVVKPVILSSLLGVNLDDWEAFLKEHCGSYIQTSYDGKMRGSNYVKRWESKVREAIDRGLSVGTISVVNETLIKDGPVETMRYLTQLGVKETGWLPFMLNEQNADGKYQKYAPTMTAFNDFMINLCEEQIRLRDQGRTVPHVGELDFVLNLHRSGGLSNMAAQTLFLLPDGTMCLPDYKNGYQEYFKHFGNILEEGTTFQDILNSRPRREYMVRQLTRNNNPECSGCEYSNRCLLEFAKPNKADDECFGGKRFISWALTDRRVYHREAGGFI